jgi:hypothetical protein
LSLYVFGIYMLWARPVFKTSYVFLVEPNLSEQVPQQDVRDQAKNPFL